LINVNGIICGNAMEKLQLGGVERFPKFALGICQMMNSSHLMMNSNDELIAPNDELIASP